MGLHRGRSRVPSQRLKVHTCEFHRYFPAHSAGQLLWSLIGILDYITQSSVVHSLVLLQKQHLHSFSFFESNFFAIDELQCGELANCCRTIQLFAGHRVVADCEFKKEWNAGQLLNLRQLGDPVETKVQRLQFKEVGKIGQCSQSILFYSKLSQVGQANERIRLQVL